MIDIADDEGDGTAATKSVRLKAAKAVIGESDSQLTVNVGVHANIGTPIGYAYAPCNRPTIDAEPAALPRDPEPALERRPSSSPSCTRSASERFSESRLRSQAHSRARRAGKRQPATRAWVPRLEGPNLTLAPAQVGVTRSTLSCPSSATVQMGGKREKACVGRMQCLRHSGSFFRWRAGRDFRHHGVRTRAASASQYALDDFLGTSRSTALKSRRRGLRTDMLVVRRVPCTST
jgi:hypothetical protein